VEPHGGTLAEAVELREKHGVPIHVSCGAGVDSTGLLVGMYQQGIRPDAVVFADVGNENPRTYMFLPHLDAWLRSVGFPPLTVVRNKPTVSASEMVREARGKTYATLEQNVVLHETLPSISLAGGRGCSQKWKHQPQEAWANQREDCQSAWEQGFKVTKLIGYSSDPADKRRPDMPDDEKYHYQYPLREWGWDRERCKKEIAAAGMPVPVKSACWFCTATKPHELRRIVSEYPDIGRRIIQMEAAAEDNLRKIRGLWGTPVKGARGALKKPGTMAEWIIGEELLPEFKGQDIVDPWWRQSGQVTPGNEHFKVADVMHLVDAPPPPVSPLEDLSGLAPVDTDELREQSKARKRGGAVQTSLFKSAPRATMRDGDQKFWAAMALIQAFDQFDSMGKDGKRHGSE